MNLDLQHRPGVDDGDGDGDGEWNWDLDWGGNRRGCRQLWVAVNADDIVMVVHKEFVRVIMHLIIFPFWAIIQSCN